MNYQELKDRTRVTRASGYNSYQVTITYRGKEYTCRSNNSLAWDNMDDFEGHNSYHTPKQALQAFYDECKQKNGLK